jgi:hypothetical protein
MKWLNALALHRDEHCVTVIGVYLLTVLQCINVSEDFLVLLRQFCIFSGSGTRTVLNKLKSYHNFCR